jgi:hypothetical protein
MLGQHVIQPVWHAPALGVGQKVMGVDLFGIGPPGPAAVAEVADEFLFLGIHAEDRQPLSPKFLDSRLQVVELPIPVRVRRPSETLDVDEQVVVEVTQQVSHGPRAGVVAQRFQAVAERLQAAAGILDFGHRVAAGDRLDQLLQVLDDLGIFFFTGGLPAPGLRMRSVGRPARPASSSSRPRRMVSTWRPVMRATRASPP